MSLTLTREEIEELTGYQWPSKQLSILRQQGFFRARIGRAGNVLLERTHYTAVCAGSAIKTDRPQVRVPKLRQVA
ncbi:DUF4224 domain-containing protein [Delftia sp. ZNC0008]|uniref:DUF4224 domain-containing protein n=1 Tax=Delftia sp. ZNC0008 TaxID=1339242 RepID=UPI000648663F|nr:DUF4224 domain-containing protein [Delftia sp. ZNC0008]